MDNLISMKNRGIKIKSVCVLQSKDGIQVALCAKDVFVQTAKALESTTALLYAPQVRTMEQPCV